MQVGVVFPQTEIGADPGAVREYVQAVEDLGYSHIFIVDHVLGADPRFHPELQPIPYTHESIIHEPFILMGYMAAITKTLGLATGVDPPPKADYPGGQASCGGGRSQR